VRHRFSLVVLVVEVSAESAGSEQLMNRLYAKPTQDQVSWFMVSAGITHRQSFFAATHTGQRSARAHKVSDAQWGLLVLSVLRGVMNHAPTSNDYAVGAQFIAPAV
jgi:hypothetical protein